jgi:uncharacterized protein YjbI with pentapeptide repeats
MISKTTVWEEFIAGKPEKDEYYENMRVRERIFKDLQATNVKIDRGWWENVNLNEAKLEKLKLTDVRWEECVMSNAEMYMANWQRVEILGSKLTGLELVSPILEDVMIKECSAHYLQMRFGKTKRLIFESCDLKKADFQGTDLSGCLFRNCDLSDAEFSGAKLANTDLRGCNVENIRIGPAEIRGAIVNTTQALYLAGLLGIEIED